MKKQEITYDYSCKVRGKEIRFRKWKVKDRKKFIALLKDIENIKDSNASDVLVYDCLELPNTILSPDEFRYVLTQIRKESISETIDFKLLCSNCEEVFNINLDLDYLIKPEFSSYTNIKVQGYDIEICDVVNKEYYDKSVKATTTADELYMVDFLYHIKSVNGDKSFTFVELEEYFEDINTDEIDSIFDQWDKMKFIINDVNDVTCPNCSNVEKYIFDDLPGFFPNKWFVR